MGHDRQNTPATVAANAARFYRLVETFTPFIIYAPDSPSLKRVRQQLTKAVSTLIEVAPGKDVFHRIRLHLEELKDKRPVLWIQQEDFEESIWRETLPELNWRRDWFGQNHPVFLVLAGPPALRELIANYAPDLRTFAQFRNLHQRFDEGHALRWLHLSDFRFVKSRSWQERAELRDLASHLQKLTVEERPDLIFVTGDIAATGQPSEYDLARDFFEHLAQCLDRAPSDSWFLVPGNHDVDRTRIKMVDSLIINQIDNQADLKEILGHGETMNLISHRLQAFYGFTKDFLGPERAWSPQRPWRTDLVSVEGYQVGVLQLNTAWSGGLDFEKGHLLIGKFQIQDQLSKVDEAEYCFALAHHSLSDLAYFDKDEAAEALNDQGVSLLLIGQPTGNGSLPAEESKNKLIELNGNPFHDEFDSKLGFQTGLFAVMDRTQTIYEHLYYKGKFTKEELRLINPNAQDESSVDSPIISLEKTKQEANSLPEDEAGGEQVWSSKMILVGEGGVGKTSLLRRLRNEPFRIDEATTHGLAVHSLKMDHPKQKVVPMTLNCWDFGGQQILHATHQFFLTDRALFLLVWNARLGYQQGKIYTWLDNIKVRAPNALILMVATHSADWHANLPFTEIVERYPRVVGQISIDNREKLGFGELREAIQTHAADLPLMGQSWPRRWLAVARAIQARKEKYIFSTQFNALMEAEDVLGESATVLTIFLHQLGDLLFFRDNSQLKDMVVLDPAWMARHISEMLASDLIAFGLGYFKAEHMALIWKDVDPPARDLFLNLMEEFDLSYRTRDNDSVSVVVEKLGADPPSPPHDYETPWRKLAEAPSITLRYHLNTVPPGIPSWFIARSHRFSTDRHWRRGALLSNHKGHLGLVRLDESRNRLELAVRGPFPQNFFALLRDGLELTLARYPGLDIEREVPCPGHDGSPCSWQFPLDVLEKALSHGRQTIECYEALRPVPLAQLIYGQVAVEGTTALMERLDNMAPDQVAGRAALEGLLQREFLKLDDNSLPRLFLVWERQEGLLQRLNRLGGKLLEIQLYCEAEGCWHQPKIDGRYTFKFDPAWQENLQPYYESLIQLMQKTLPSLGASLAASLQEQDFKVTNETAKPLSPQSKRQGNNPAAFWRLLRKLDPTGANYGLTRLMTKEGHVFWVCDDHYDLYQRDGQFRPL